MHLQQALFGEKMGSKGKGDLIINRGGGKELHLKKERTCDEMASRNSMTI